ncbi:hypothetical protein CEV31_3911 [Brucella thiophenivorans]|uniref:Uncharacterized protein n=1 Tax=Brucella thiophenivorans TaxID=571255 RepID=A0A256F344_9HYPH|nr:hypothetical protein CEV31_3911 [Brucella thiophenivorans]
MQRDDKSKLVNRVIASAIRSHLSQTGQRSNKLYKFFVDKTFNNYNYFDINNPVTST